MKQDLQTEAEVIRTGWSCQDLILNGDEITIDDCFVTSTAEANSQSNWLEVLPNPSDGYFNLNFNVPEMGDYKLNLFDLQGQVVFSEELQATTPFVQGDIYVPDLSPGSYILSLTTEDGSSYSEKISVMER